MQQADFDAFCKILDGACTLLSRGAYLPNAASSALFFRALAPFSLAQVSQALSAHVSDPKRGRFVPMPADVIEQIQAAAADDGRPGPEEAWAIAARSADEAETVVWTQEIAEAFGVARVLQIEGDGVGARMAFKETYGRLVESARARRVPVAWSASEGHDPERRQAAIVAAIEAGRLPESQRLTLAAPRGGQPLLELSRRGDAPAHAKEALLALKERLAARTDEPSFDAAQKHLTEARKRDIDERVQHHLGAQQPNTQTAQRAAQSAAAAV